MAVQSIQIDIVTVTSTSSTLADLLGGALRAGNKITLEPHAAGIYFNDTTADANSAPMGLNSKEIRGGIQAWQGLQFYAASDTKMTVVQEDDGEE